MRRRSLSISLVALVFPLACTPTGPGTGGGNDAGTPQIRTCTVDGVEMPKPLAHATTQAGNAPDLSCVDNPVQLEAGSSVTAEGCVDIFGLGGKAKTGLRIAFYDATQDPTVDQPQYGDTEILTKSGGSEEAAACSKEGWYTKDALPTNRPLIIKVYDTATGPAQTAIPTYTYLEILPAELVVDGVIEYEANLIYKTTYDSIPTLGGRRVDGQQIIYDGEGRGVIAGEVHDCNGELVEGASVSSSRMDSNTRVAYFNGDEDDPSPDLGITTTNYDALYTVLNAATDEGANDHEIVAAILDPACTEADLADCECVKAGGASIRVFPDSVSIFSPEGTFPEAAQ